jgi:hypothetical protein
MVSKYGMYDLAMGHVRETRLVREAIFSVIIQTGEYGAELDESLRRIRNDHHNKAQVVIIQNNGKDSDTKLQEAADHYVQLRESCTAAMANNIGSLFAVGPILFFLDHRALVNPDILQAYRDVFEKYEPVAVRGACSLLNSDNPFNKDAAHCHIGKEILPRYGDLPGNTAYLRKFFFTVKGFFDPLPGLEGMELSSRLHQIIAHDHKRQLYSPHALVHMDVARTKDEHGRLMRNQAQAWKLLEAKRPLCLQYIQDFAKAVRQGHIQPIRLDAGGFTQGGM